MFLLLVLLFIAVKCFVFNGSYIKKPVKIWCTYVLSNFIIRLYNRFLETHNGTLRFCHVTHLQGSTAKKEDINGLAVFLCYLCTNHSTMLPILLTGINHPAEKTVSEVFTVI